jgi:hypothetical protein
MLIIEPYSVDTAVDILAINVPEDDAYPAWSAAVRYSEGEVVTTGSGESLQIWQARLGSVAPIDSGSGLPALYNEAIDPTGANTVGRDSAGTLLPNATEYQHFGELWWRDATDDGYLSNRFRMFDPNPARVTRSANPIEFDIRPQTPWSGIALFNINADVVSIELIDGPAAYSATRTLRYPEILSPAFQNEPQAAFVDIPPVDPAIHPNAFLRVRLEATASRWIHVGCVIIGPAIRLGHALYGLETELMDFSRFTRDTFGNITTIQRGYSDKTTYPHVIPAEFIGQARQILVARRATLTAYIGHPDVALTITYGYFIDLDVPIEGHSQTSASVVVESVLYDTPDSGEPLPDRVVFIEPDGAACVEEHLGPALTLCLSRGRVVDQASATILDVALGPLDTVEWALEWVEGGSEHLPAISILVTDCDQRLPVLTWPESVPVSQGPAVAVVRATITKDDDTEIVLEPATLIVGSCDGGDCACSLDVSDYGFGDSSDDYALKSTTETVTLDAKEIDFRVPTFIQGCAGEDRYYWCNITPSPGYGIAYWGIELSEGASACAYAVLDGIPTTSAFVHRCGAGKVGVPTWEGASNVVVLVEYSESETTQLTVDATFGVPMNDTIVLILPPGDTDDLIVSEIDPTYYLIEIPIEDGETLDAAVVTVDGGSTLNIYVGIGTDPFPTETDPVVSGDGSLTLTPLNTPGAGTFSVMLMIPPTVGYEGGVTLNVQPVYAQTLTVQSATHGQTATNIDLVQAHTLAIQSSTHGQTADTARAIPDVTLDVQSATHGQIADSAQVLQHFTLEVQSTTHGQTADHIGNDSVLRDSATAIIRDVNGSILRVKTGGLIT